MTEGEGHHSFLEPRRHLVGHARQLSFSRLQHLQAVPLHDRPPAVIGGAMEAKLTTRLAHADDARATEHVDSHAEQHVIIGQRAVLLRSLNNPRMDRSSMPGYASQVSLYLPSRSS